MTDLSYNFFETDNILDPKKGRVLISEPFLLDNYFKRSIVFLTEHNNEGTIGFVLNKPVDVSIEELLEDFPKMDVSFSLGGPVSTNTLHFIHTLGDIIPNSIHVKDDIFWGGNFEVVEKLIISGKIKENQIRFFLGYSGWRPNQLDDELEDNAWVVTEIPSEEIMSTNNEYFWNKMLRKMGAKYEMWSNFPENPEMN